MSAVRALFSFLRNRIIFRFRLITFGNIHFYLFPFFPELERIRTRRGANGFRFLNDCVCNPSEPGRQVRLNFVPCFSHAGFFHGRAEFIFVLPLLLVQVPSALIKFLSHHLPLAPALGFFSYCGAVRTFDPFNLSRRPVLFIVSSWCFVHHGGDFSGWTFPLHWRRVIVRLVDR